MVRLGLLTALSKPDGGVRGILAGDVIRRLVGRTKAQQLSQPVEAATAPHQYGFSTKAGCECAAHILQGLTEMNPETTVTLIDGVSAYDLISRESMLKGLRYVVGSNAVLPFVRLFYGRPSVYLWEDDLGTVHRIPQGEGGEQRDALMPLLFVVGQHQALEAAQRQLWPGESLFAYLDNIYMVTSPDRVGAVYAIVQEGLRVHACIEIHGGKTRVWNRAGLRPEACNVLERIAPTVDPTAVVLRGSDFSPIEQGLEMLGTPLGHPDFVESHLQSVARKQQVFLERIPMVSDVQSSWLLLLHCASARANFQLSVVRPTAVENFFRTNNVGMWQCLSKLLRIDLSQCELTVREAATLPMSLGGLRLRSAGRIKVAVFWASWSDCLPMIRARHPAVATELVRQLEGIPTSPEGVDWNHGIRTSHVEGDGGVQ